MAIRRAAFSAACLACLAPRTAAAQDQQPSSVLGEGLFGHLFQQTPFQGINLADIAIIAVLIFVAWRLWSSMKDQTGPARRPPEHNPDVNPREASEAYRRASQTWDHLSSKPKTGAPARGEGIPETTTLGAGGLPEGFDPADFIKGAKAFYVRFKESWDQRDLDDLAQFTTPAMHRELLSQAHSDPGPSGTTVLTLDAKLVEARQEAGATTAEVAYNVLLQEKGDKKPKDVREVWRFSREDSGTWRLDSMERVQ